MKTILIKTNKPKDDKLIKAIESIKGWFIEWNNNCIKLSADTENRLQDLKEFVNIFIKQ